MAPGVHTPVATEPVRSVDQLLLVAFQVPVAVVVLDPSGVAPLISQ